MERKTLNPNQLRFLQVLSGEGELASEFYLSGGTALVGYYIPYRISEDLDFFSEVEFDQQSLAVFIKKHKTEIGYFSFDFQKSFNRNLFFLQFEGEILKVEFTYYPFPRIGVPTVADGVKIDSLLDIAVNKIFTISQNPRTRDFIDLYFIVVKEGFDFFDLLKKARIKFDWHIDPINLGSQLMKSQEIKDYPRLIEKIDDSEWQSYYQSVAMALSKKIFK